MMKRKKEYYLTVTVYTENYLHMPLNATPRVYPEAMNITDSSLFGMKLSQRNLATHHRHHSFACCQSGGAIIPSLFPILFVDTFLGWKNFADLGARASMTLHS